VLAYDDANDGLFAGGSNRADDFSQLFALARDLFAAGPAQNEPGLRWFMRLAAASRPEVVCEIRTQDGGKLFLLGCQLTTTNRLIGIDLPVRLKGILRLLILGDRHPTFIDGPSHSARPVERMKNLLGGRKITRSSSMGTTALERRSRLPLARRAGGGRRTYRTS